MAPGATSSSFKSQPSVGPWKVCASLDGLVPAWRSFEFPSYHNSRAGYRRKTGSAETRSAPSAMA